MKYVNNYDIDLNKDENSVVVLGFFDGLHLGHLKLIEQLNNYKKDKKTKKIIFTFYPHPAEILGDKTMLHLFSRNERVEIFETLNIDTLVEYPFTKEFSQISGEDFVKDILINKLNCKCIIVGEGFLFGKNNECDTNTLKLLGKKYNIEIIVQPHFLYKNEKLSSSIIRKHLINKNLTLVNELLYNSYFISGEIIKGKQLGRTIGFPTINVIPDKNKLLPIGGVFGSNVILDNKKYKSITNLGVNPTVNGTNTIAESHIFDFDDNIYGKKVKIQLIELIRDEKKFDNIEMLKNQIEIDSNYIRNKLL